MTGRGWTRKFAERDALMGGYSAACKSVDDLFCREQH